MRRSYQSRDEAIAASEAGTPIPDGSGRLVRKGRIISAGDAARAAATRAMNAASDRQAGGGAQQSGSGYGQQAADPSGGGGGPESPTRAYGQTLRRAYADISAMKGTREQKVNAAKKSGTFTAIRDDWNARNKSAGRFMDEEGNIHDMSVPATDDTKKADGPAGGTSPVLRVGPAFQSPEERAADREHVKSEQAATQAQIDADADAATGGDYSRRRRARNPTIPAIPASTRRL